MAEPVPYTGLEWKIVNDGNTPDTGHLTADSPTPDTTPPLYSFEDKTLTPFDGTIITGQKVFVRYRQDDVDNPGDPEIDWTYTTTYPSFTITAATITTNAPHNDPNPFSTNNGTEFYTILDAVEEEPPTITVSNWADQAGITDNTEYNYFAIFDQAYSSFLPYESAYDAEPLINQPIPTTPFDPDAIPPQFPIDSLFAFTPDSRSSVDVVYTVTITYYLSDPNSPASATIEVDQTCIQPSNDWGSIIRQYQDRSSYVNGYRAIRNIDGTNDPWTWGTESVGVGFE